MMIYAILWVLCAGSCIWMTTRSGRTGVGLPAAFVLSMSFLYCGFVAYLAPGYRHDRPHGDLYLLSYDFDARTVLLGVQASILGLFGFFIGTLISSSIIPAKIARMNPAVFALEKRSRNRLLLVFGTFAVVGFLLTGTRLQIPLLEAILLVARNCSVVVVCLGAATVVLFDGQRQYGRWIGAAALIPLAYLIAFGFLSYGFIVFTCFAGFWLAVLRRRQVSLSRLIVGIITIAYLLLSGFLTWMGSRAELRAVLWSDAGFADRLTATWAAFSQIRPLNFANFADLDLLNLRLNQYIFVGKVIEHHALRPDLWLNGESLYMSLLAWIPRFLWPGKPEMNSTEFLAQHSGMAFSSSAAFGTGPVIEFYANFGWTGILLGFIGLGILLSWLDRKAARALYAADSIDFIRWFAVGLAFVAPLTSMFFMVNTALITFMLMTIIRRRASPRWRGRVSDAPRDPRSFRGGSTVAAESHDVETLHGRP